MIVLLTGASGFIGRQLAAALSARGHEVICAVRRPPAHPDPRYRYVAADFTRDFDADDWLPCLQGVDAVINAVGIIREHGAQTFEAIHARAPCALFSACAAAGIRLVLQVSALGADDEARSRYHLSKKRADDFLASLPLHSVIVQPSVVFGEEGASARMFTTLASLPLIGVPGTGGQQIQPVHIDDVIAALSALLDRPAARGMRVPLVGPQAMSLRDFLARLRQAMGLGKARFLPMPMPLMRFAAAAGKLLPSSLLDAETLDMLERGNTADPEATTALLGRQPRAVQEFIAAADVAPVRLRAQANWLLPLLRISIALVWIVTGIVSLGFYPVADSYALLARVGITGALAPLMLYGAALMDLAFGVATLVLRRRRLLWLAQLAAIVFYTVVISWRLPEFWLHPYGPLLKNLPMMAAIWLLFETEER
jgi:uncharacterized protein YbjT (DUF2867 family)